MAQNLIWLDWAVRLQALAQAGLYYGKDPFDRERYAEIRSIAAQMIAHQGEMPFEKVQDREKHNQPVYAYKICKIFVRCTVIGGAFRENTETVASDYFWLDALPPLAEEKNNREQIAMCLAAQHAEHWKTLLD